jgi:hypothetical protein
VAAVERFSTAFTRSAPRSAKFGLSKAAIAGRAGSAANAWKSEEEISAFVPSGFSC